MRLQTAFWAITTSFATFSIGGVARADSTEARCDIYPRGQDQASAVMPCTFSQNQGYVTIELQDGTTYELAPSPTEADTYTDQDGLPATREFGIGDAGHIYRLADESIYVYWDATIDDGSEQTSSESSSSSTIVPAESTNIDLVDETVADLSDLVGARAGQAENLVVQRGYEFVRSEADYDNRVFGYWREPGTGLCVSIITEEGRYDTIVYSDVIDQTECR